ncbi:helix-turn-helix domain-containing protein [Halomonas heilongjiangensis]|uniref:AraC family transcriptional regulator n=1 Tax=Halomonas heilongjiangensis TaxID=1387883 RepID=A0A2N7TFI7_9GAMM|nr:AraC family transcriptional regulator [Halomonas heilongjiangensis]PMR66938.1 AraC family transcriptional regulator [Halomonas heilongjiangensis]PXX88552.1 AraC family transcriptional regulator [Halomonas heilongjiangensis]
MNETSVSPPARQDCDPAPDRKRNDDETAQTIATAKQYIDENFCEPINLDDLAELVGMTRFSLSKRFRQRFGISPYRYVCQVRVRQAQTMMEQGQRPTEIASEIGFFDQSHLARHFKRLCGMTPRQYRTRCIQSAGQ